MLPRYLFLMIALLAATGGCAGYQLGPRSLYPPNIRTVQVNMFRSDSLRPFLGERLTEAVAKEIENRSTLKIISNGYAESVLNGRLLSEAKTVLAENLNDEPRDIEVGMLIEVTWTDQQGQPLMQRAMIPVAPLIDISQRANFVPEAGQSMTTAQQEVIDRLAKQVVDQMEVRW